MAETLTASGGSISDASVEDFPSSQEVPALGSECLNSVSTSKIPPFSTRIATMMQNRKNYIDQVESDIASSKVHWSALEDEVESEDDETCVLDEEKHEALMKANKEAFESLKRHPRWGPFFSRDGPGGMYWLKMSGSLYPKVEVGKKVAAGGQAKIYECRGINANGYQDDLMLKVFRKGSFIQDLQKEWPQTFFDPFIDGTGGIIKQGILLEDGRFAFVMRKCWGDLRRLINLNMQEKKSLGPPFRFPDYLRLMHEIARLMCDLHKHDICHKDLKADNILVDKTAYHEPGYGDIRIADYECSVGVLGTTFWRAPEILLETKNWLSARRNGNDPPPISFTKAADVYSYGMLLYEAWTGLLPFEREGFIDDPEENYDRVIRGERPELPDDMDWELKDLITKCWHGDQEQRPTFTEIYLFLRRINS